VIDNQQLRYKFLSCGKDDIFGLYEMRWWLNAQTPAATDAEKEISLVAVARRLVEEGLIELFEVHKTENRTNSAPEKPLSATRALQVIADHASWTPSRDPLPSFPYFGFATTTKLGMAQWQSMATQQFGHVH
jgi:hypothetical protein